MGGVPTEKAKSDNMIKLTEAFIARRRKPEI